MSLSFLLRFYVVNKKTGKVLSTEFLSDKPFFFLHIINTFHDEERNELVLDISAYDDPSVFELQYVEKLRSGTGLYDASVQASIRRYALPLIPPNPEVPEETNLSAHGIAKRCGKTVTLYPVEVAGRGLEMVSIHPAFQGKDYTFGYGASITAKGYFEKSVAKVNVKTKEAILWSANEHTLLGEAIFVPDPSKFNAYHNNNNNNNNNRTTGDAGFEGEDDGYLIVPSLDVREGTTDYIYFLNAKTMEEVGRAKFSIRLPPALHGHYLPYA
jgi:torulene dioxygenase